MPSKLLNNPLASYSLINYLMIEFLLLITEHFNKRIILSFLVLTNFWFLFSVFFLHSKQWYNIVLYIFLAFIFHLNFWFFLPYHKILPACYLLKLSIKALEIKTSMLFNWDFANKATLSCFFFFFLVIDL